MPSIVNTPSSSFNNVLIFGGSGFLGSHVVEAFVAEPSCAVVTISRNPNRYRTPKATYLACDVTNHSEVAKLIGPIKPRVIVHTVTPGPFVMRNAQVNDYESTRNLLELAKKSKFVKASVHTGSVEAVANSTGPREPGLREE